MGLTITDIIYSVLIGFATWGLLAFTKIPFWPFIGGMVYCLVIIEVLSKAFSHRGL